MPASLRCHCPNYPNIFHLLDLERTYIKKEEGAVPKNVDEVDLVSVVRAFHKNLTHLLLNNFSCILHGVHTAKHLSMEASVDVEQTDVEVS